VPSTRATVADRHAGPVAERAVVQAERIAGALQRHLTEPAGDGLLQVGRGPDDRGSPVGAARG